VPERLDHVALDLDLLAWLLAREQKARADGLDEHAITCADAQRKFVHDHLAWWLPTFAFAVRREAEGVQSADELISRPRSFYGAVAAVLAAFIGIERSIFQIEPPNELMSPYAGAADADPCAACCGAVPDAP
jgi:TorA maturation chaperone TorD